jgi:hypothetical protein
MNPPQVEITARYRLNAAGEVREQRMGCNTFDDGKPNPFWWKRREGNAGCDCNRAIFFHRIGGVELGDEEGPCGDDAYDVQLEGPDGIFYDEFSTRAERDCPKEV